MDDGAPYAGTATEEGEVVAGAASGVEEGAPYGSGAGGVVSGFFSADDWPYAWGTMIVVEEATGATSLETAEDCP